MPFEHIRYDEDSKFTHLASGSTISLKRQLTNGKLFLQLTLDPSGEEIADARVSSRFDKFLYKKKELPYHLLPYDFKCHYVVELILTDELCQFTHLGSLLMFVIVCEVQVNGADYLYLASPFRTSMGFFTQYGFFPAPENVTYKNHLVQRSKRHFWQPSPLISLQQAIEMRKKYRIWRGNVNSVHGLLMAKITKYFSL
ncbi:hypothetical protein [Endozoicomonas euniceicola]|uniref:GNAT family N-acetyltransferase n=1 Tax=Endozoicomonas euniceicola TaxID=1234143 RepID=A0ABY6GXU2_9GAMM|nr:hypothetical protein [Endozoicomonas euniceicola]UYM17387.1 hypothetical protein NX720_05565 [Endozoicomonas euniceicola]